MKVIYIDDNKDIIKERTVIALGNFDGIHRGHKKLIDQVLSSASTDVKPGILLFKNHTLNILSNDKSFRIITTFEDKLDILEKIGLEYIYVLDFNKRLSMISPEEFIELIYLSTNCSKIIVGNDYRFGKNAAGDIITLNKLANIYNISVEIVSDYIVDGSVVKSSDIRHGIEKGNITYANKLLDRNFTIKGKVVHGKKRGRLLGFPTANILNIYGYVLPKPGVYETITHVHGESYKSLTFIGENITFDESEIKIESYILDFSKYIYDDIIKIEFVRYLRGNILFDTKEKLIAQINRDIKTIK